tara:strand:+ start:3054 stop:4619 length:1566 start_codon:yes stop_codon:yes gene_type:complete
MVFKTIRQYELEDEKKQTRMDMGNIAHSKSKIKPSRGAKRYFSPPRSAEGSQSTLEDKLRGLKREGKDLLSQFSGNTISGSPTPPAGSSGGRTPRDSSRSKRESGGGLTWTKVKSEEKEQAMDEEEDLEELTNGELEEIEKKFEGIKRKLGNVKDRINSNYEKDHPLEKPKLTEGGKKVLDEAKRYASSDMYKSTKKVPQNRIPRSPNKENNYQTQIDKPIQQRALGEKIKKLKKGINHRGGAGEKKQQSEAGLKFARSGDHGEVLGKTPLGETDSVHTGTGGHQAFNMYNNSETGGSLGGKEIPESGGQKTQRKLTTNSGSATIGGGRTGGQKRFNEGSGKVRGTGKITLEGTRRAIANIKREQETQNDKKNKPTLPPQEDVPESSKTPELSDLARQIRQFDRKRRDKKGKIVKSWESWLVKYEETKEDKVNATKLNEKRAITEGKVRPPTPKHLVKPTWKAWLEKDQGQGDARYGNPHETGMEDPKVLQTTEDDFSMESKEDEKREGNKPYIERNGKTE